MTSATEDGDYLRELVALAGDVRAAFGPGGLHLFAEGATAAGSPASRPGVVHRFAWRPEKTRTGTTKAVGVGEDQGKTLYGDKAAAALAHPGTPRAPRPGSIRHVAPHEIAVDPQRFQFKQKTDPTTGVGRELQSVGVFNPELAGVLAVWHDPEAAKAFIVNGHHRLDLAKRSGAKKVAVRYIRAKDAREARAKGALINIAEGRGTAVDAAKFLRDTGTTVADLARAGVSLSGPVARDAVVLSDLDPGLFHRVTLGVLDVPRALAVAAHLADHDDQRTLLAHVERREAKTGREMPPAAVAEAAKEMAATPRAVVAGPASSLFGTDPQEESVFLQRAEVKAHVRRELQRLARDFTLLASRRRVENTAAAGNVIDPARNRAAGEEARGLADDFDRRVNRSGAVADAVNRAAARLANTHTEAGRGRVLKEAVGEVRRAIEGGGLQLMSEWVGELGGFWTFAWKQGKRGGRYWLPDGKQDTPPNRLYGAKADKAAKAEEGGRQKSQQPAASAGAAGGGAKPPGEAARVARAKFEVARDAHAEASRPGSGVPPEQVAWLKARMEKAGEELKKHEAVRETSEPRRAVPAGGGGGGGKEELLTPEDRAELDRRRSRYERMKAWVRDKYRQLEGRYGSIGAGVVLGGSIFGPPGSALVVPAVAEGVRAVGHALGLAGGKKEEEGRKGK